jgi:ribosomal protein S18 acetylase RimI-like enzyme
VTPGPLPEPEQSFWNERTQPDDVLVAERNGQIAGYVKMRHPTPLASNDHVWEITGLAVHPDAQGRGAGRALLEAIAAAARERGGRRLTLRVFAPNERARRLYERAGFRVEGILRGEFRAGDEFVDDVLMALDLLR